MSVLYICAVAIMINQSPEPWTDRDYANMHRAKKTCKKVYKQCLKKFIKREPLNYHAICGGKKEDFGK